MDKKKRPRMEPIILTPIVDPLEYKPNLCTLNARYLKGFDETLNMHFWIDKHYSIRDTHGDDDGVRENIGIEFVEPLVKKAFSHLLYYASKFKRFAFLNHKVNQNGRNIRITLKEHFNDEQTLNVIVEYHYLKLNEYEVTVKTAMRKDNFTFSNGDYSVEFKDSNSELIQNDRGKYITIDEYTE